MDAEVKLVGVFWCLVFGFFGLVGAAPVGPDFLNITANETWGGSATGSEINVSGGIVSSLNISATIQNSRWKAFVGWVSGEFSLEDSGGSSIYDWSLGSLGGEVYATRNSSSIDWGNIGCAQSGDLLAEDLAMNHSGNDNISSTFSETNNGTYVVAGTNIGKGACFAANSYVNDVSQNSSFEEFVLWDSASIVFATEIEDSAVGYDGIAYDFQMIVPENGDESFGGSTAYYLYVEIS